MSDRPVLVAGASGLAGSHLLATFRETSQETVGTALSQTAAGLERLDLRDADAVRELVRSRAPGAVVCAAAIPNVEQCELEPEATREVNVAGTLALAEAAREAGAPFVFLSSEYVFDGTDGPYSEDDPTNPINEYGRQKVAVEEALAGAVDDFIVARVSCVYGHEARRKNFVYQLWSALSAGRELKVPGDQVGSPTAAANAAEVIRDLLRAGKRGIFHVVGPDRMIRSDFASIAAEELGLDTSLVRPTATAELGLAAARPLGAGLLNDRAAAAAGTPLVGIREGIRRMLEQAPLEAAA